jgi:hypothetical protein
MFTEWSTERIIEMTDANDILRKFNSTRAFRLARETDQMRFAAYLEWVIFNGDPRTGLPSFADLVTDGKPDAPSLIAA